MRNTFSRMLVEAAQRDPRVILLTGDHGYALFDEIRKVCPDQYLNAGVAEQNMVGVAAGLAKGGMRPIVYGLSAFVPVRVLEQIKLDVCYESLPVIFVGDGAGVVYSSLGTSHQSTEDIAALRAVPNLAILSPADAAEMAACMKLSLSAPGPVYLRMGKADLGQVHAIVPNLKLGQLCQVRPGFGSIGWLATGSMVQTALAVSDQWPNCPVWSVPSIKPIDERAVRSICEQHEVLIVLEEHSVHGGLGSAIAEIASTTSPTWVCRIGIRDRFSKHCGSYRYLMQEHQLDPASVTQQVQAFLASMPAKDTRSIATRPAA